MSGGPCRPTRSGRRQPPAQGPKGPAVAKKDGGRKADGQAAVQCKRMGDPSHVGEDAPAPPLAAGS